MFIGNHQIQKKGDKVRLVKKKRYRDDCEVE